MKILIKRIAKLPTYTIGKMYIDGKYVCDTLEDTDRGLNSLMSKEEIIKKKIYGETAIPIGEYKVDLNTISPKFKNRSWAKPWGGKLPRLKEVKGFEGVLIHVGNSSDDTLGCILVGQNKVKGRLINSTSTFSKLMAILQDQKEIILTIE